MENLIKSLGPDITWPKDFPELKLIDESLRCGICYEYLQTVMVTPCAHSYCSICIRKYLSYKTACPICFEETYESNLRNNRILDRIVELYSHIRDKLIKHLKIAAIHFNCNEKLSITQSVSSQHMQKSSQPTETPKNSSKKLASKASSTKGKLNFPSNSPSTSSDSKKSEIAKRLEDILGSPASSSKGCDSILPLDDFPTVPSMFLKDIPQNQTQAKADMLLVSCPVCLVGIPERNINLHLDSCLANSGKPVKSPVKKNLKRKPLPKMVWQLMAEKDLRKKLKDYGLSTQGDKRTLITRIQRYITLYNSECDKENPKSVSEIIKAVEREEKQIPMVQIPQRLIHKKTDPKVVEEENKKYIEENKESFKKLIEAMREREGRNIKPLRPINRLSSDEEDEINPKKGNNIEESSICKVSVVNLCDSGSSSPILDSWAGDKPGVNGMFSNSNEEEEKVSEDQSSEDIFLPHHRQKSKTPVKKTETPTKDIQGSDSCIERGEDLCDDEDLFHISPTRPSCNDIGGSETPAKDIRGSLSCSEVGDELCDAEALFHSSPSRPPSPSCIITAHSDSDSEASISILIDQNLDDDFPETAELATESADRGMSQQCDPDFVPNTEDQQEESEEVFVSKNRRSKRKQDKVKVPSPRRTRRRLNK